MTFSEHLPVLPLIILFVSSYVCVMMPRRLSHLAVWVTVVATGIVFLLSVELGRQVFLYGTRVYHLSSWPPPWGIELQADSLGSFTLVVLTLISFLVSVFSSQALGSEVDGSVHSLYYGLYLVLLAAMSGMGLSNDLFNIFVFAEVGAIAAAGLVAVKGSGPSIEAGLKYLMLSTMGSGLFLFGVAMIYMVTGYLNLGFISMALPTAVANYPSVVAVAAGMIFMGLAVKAALYPLHVWLPDAHSTAPAASSAILSGLVVKIYIVLFIRLFYQSFGPRVLEMIPVMSILLWTAVLGIFTGSVVAMLQTDIKRMLAWSTIGQIGFIFLGLAVLSPNALVGGLFHILAHAVVKSMLFLCAGAMIYASGRRRIADLEGAGAYMPIPMVAFTIGSLSMVGIPGLAGFVSKVYLAMGSLDAGMPALVMVILGSSFLNAVYFLPIVIRGFFSYSPPPPSTFSVRPLPWPLSFTLITLAGITLFFGFFPSIALNLVIRATQVLWGA